MKSRRPGILSACTSLVCAAWLWAGMVCGQQQPSREHQIRAAFLYNFTQFVEWPAGAFAAPDAPLVIGVLGQDPFGAYLDETVRGEEPGGHPLVVKRYDDIAAVGRCHILFINPAHAGRLEPLLASLEGRSILTVGENDDFIKAGGMIRFYTENNKTRLQINLAAAKAAGLTISAKLLRLADVVTP